MGQAPIFDTEINKAPTLRISHIVRGRRNDGGRVNYLVDPKGNGEARAIPEDVVLIRWRKRIMKGHTFHGCRLGPNLWRGVDKVLGRDALNICGLEKTVIETAQKRLNSGKGVNGGVKFGHCGGAKVGQFGASALERAALISQARSKAHWPSGQFCEVHLLAAARRARL